MAEKVDSTSAMVSAVERPYLLANDEIISRKTFRLYSKSRREDKASYFIISVGVTCFLGEKEGVWKFCQLLVLLKPFMG